jgi:hypothetical protein
LLPGFGIMAIIASEKQLESVLTSLMFWKKL